ncbi:MAG: hypothetical protein KGJ13_07320 [Patescibacteria group bacterium]|nr:hypothetical protein [Patescibacteria group bacterium]
MRWNPLFNAAGAAAYIGGVAALVRFISSFRANTPDTFLDSMAFLSLLVFSAAVMGFLFFYRPVALMIENQKKEALIYFLKTLGFFGVITALAVITMSLQ